MDNNFNSNNMSSANINPGTPDIENNGYNGQVQNTSDNGQVTDNSQMFSQQAGEPQINAKAPEGVGQPYTFYQVQQGEKVDEKKKKAKKKKVKKPMTFGRVFSVGLALMLVTVLINTGILYGVLEYTDWGRSANDNRNVVVGTTLQNGTAEVTGTSTGTSNGEYTVADIAKMVKPSVVSITNTSIVDQNYNPFYGGSGQYQVKGAGSGIIIGINDKELLIVTNNHVVEDSVSLSVQFINDKTIDTAYVKGTNSTSDIAVVGIPIDDLDDDTLNAIKVATLGSSDDLSEGDQVATT